jgi:hypothetical protein
MSKYRRDDKQFRDQIATLADAGLKFPTAPAYARVIEPSDRVLSPVVHYEIAPKNKLPEFVAGIVTGAALLAGLTFLVKIIMMIGGAH